MSQKFLIFIAVLALVALGNCRTISEEQSMRYKLPEEHFENEVVYHKGRLYKRDAEDESDEEVFEENENQEENDDEELFGEIENQGDKEYEELFEEIEYQKSRHYEHSQESHPTKKEDDSSSEEESKEKENTLTPKEQKKKCKKICKNLQPKETRKACKQGCKDTYSEQINAEQLHHENSHNHNHHKSCNCSKCASNKHNHHGHNHSHEVSHENNTINGHTKRVSLTFTLVQMPCGSNNNTLELTRTIIQVINDSIKTSPATINIQLNTKPINSTVSNIENVSNIRDTTMDEYVEVSQSTEKNSVDNLVFNQTNTQPIKNLENTNASNSSIF